MEGLGPNQVALAIARAKELGSSPSYSARASNFVSTRAWRGTIECVLLNTCYTPLLGVALREKGVLHVVWSGTARSIISHATKFAEEFFEDLRSHVDNTVTDACILHH